MLFDAGSAILSPEASAELNALVSSIRDTTQRVQLKAHATTADNGASARRLSLKRALASRAYLIDQGIESTRIDVRALGPANDGGPPDRVDLIVLGP